MAASIYSGCFAQRASPNAEITTSNPNNRFSSADSEFFYLGDFVPM